jgi:hypothetical protein
MAGHRPPGPELKLTEGMELDIDTDKGRLSALRHTKGCHHIAG